MGLVLSPLILQRWGWRALFYTFGLLGGPLLLLWSLVVPGQQAQQQAQQAQQQQQQQSSGGATPSSISLLSLLSKPATWAIIIVNFINHWGEAMLLGMRGALDFI